MTPEPETILKAEVEHVENVITFAMPVLIVLERPLPPQFIAESLQKLHGPNPLYNLVATGIKNGFGPARGAVKVIVGFPEAPALLTQSFAVLGMTYGHLDKPGRLETDDGEKLAIQAAAWIAANCDAVLVRELLMDHINKQSRGK